MNVHAQPVDHHAVASGLLASAGAIAHQAHEYEGNDGRQAYAQTLATMAIAESILALVRATTESDDPGYPVGTVTR